MKDSIYYKIGIDVGGTNTDAVLLTHQNQLVNKAKQYTTQPVMEGISNVLQKVIAESSVDARQIKYIMLGTTQCTNAVVERKGLLKVGVIRLCLPAAQLITPLFDTPDELQKAIQLKTYLAKGGYEFNGNIISDIDEEEIRGICLNLKGKIDALSIIGIFSSINPNQELQVEAIAKVIFGEDFLISLSHQIGSVGLLERENATVLNSALMDVAKKMVNSLQAAAENLSLQADLFFIQNDGTLLTLEAVKNFPILTLACGPTNSIRGAGVLSGIADAIVIDIGGTTADAGILTNGFLRESLMASTIGGVKTNFRMPDITSIGLGGGTIVSLQNNTIVITHQSLGYQIVSHSLAFGGNVCCLNDFAVANGWLSIEGTPDSLQTQKIISTHFNLPFDEINKIIKNAISEKVESLIDKMKTSKQDVTVIAVGGGSVLMPNAIEGVNKIIKPLHYEVANAFGAALAQTSGESTQVFNLSSTTREQAIQIVTASAKQNAITNGALNESLELLFIDEVPLAYIPNTIKLKAKVIGKL